VDKLYSSRVAELFDEDLLVEFLDFRPSSSVDVIATTFLPSAVLDLLKIPMTSEAGGEIARDIAALVQGLAAACSEA